MTTFIPFTFDDTPVRVLDRDSLSWFVLADVCRVLEIGSPHQAAARLDEDEKTTMDTRDTTPGIGSCDLDPRVQSITLITESGLYALILTSRKPEARRFRRWVTAEVLPTLRRTGRYGIPTPAAPALSVRDCRRLALWPVLRANLSDRRFVRLPMARLSNLTGLTPSAIEQALHDLVRDGIIECQEGEPAVPFGRPDPVWNDLEAAARRLSCPADLTVLEPLLEDIALARFEPVPLHWLLLTIKATTRIPVAVLDKHLRGLRRRLPRSDRDRRTFRLTGRGLPEPAVPATTDVRARRHDPHA